MTPDQPTPPSQSTNQPNTREYWLSRTSAERFAEVERLRREKHGDEAMQRRIERVISIGRLDYPEPEDNA